MKQPEPLGVSLISYGMPGEISHSAIGDGGHIPGSISRLHTERRWLHYDRPSGEGNLDRYVRRVWDFFAVNGGSAMTGARMLSGVLWVGVLYGLFSPSADAADHPLVHGLWVWSGPSVVEAPRGAEMLRDFCRSAGINEVYISVSEHGDMSGIEHFSHLVDLLHSSNIRVEALLSSEDADEPGQHREKLLDHVRRIVQFNQRHQRGRFDGIHLDIEPQQRPENKGAGNLRFLPGLVDTYRAVRALAEPAGLTANADIQSKLLKGSSGERDMLLSSLPRFTLMLYELSSPEDRESIETKTEKLRTTSQKFLAMAYEGLHDPSLASMVVGLRTPDYGELLPQMLDSLDEANRGDPHYQGWARHSYNDSLRGELP